MLLQPEEWHKNDKKNSHCCSNAEELPRKKKVVFHKSHIIVFQMLRHLKFNHLVMKSQVGFSLLHSTGSKKIPISANMPSEFHYALLILGIFFNFISAKILETHFVCSSAYVGISFFIKW